MTPLGLITYPSLTMAIYSQSPRGNEDSGLGHSRITRDRGYSSGFYLRLSSSSLSEAAVSPFLGLTPELRGESYLVELKR